MFTKAELDGLLSTSQLASYGFSLLEQLAAYQGAGRTSNPSSPSTLIPVIEMFLHMKEPTTPVQPGANAVLRKFVKHIFPTDRQAATNLVLDSAINRAAQKELKTTALTYLSAAMLLLVTDRDYAEYVMKFIASNDLEESPANLLLMNRVVYFHLIGVYVQLLIPSYASLDVKMKKISAYMQICSEAMKGATDPSVSSAITRALDACHSSMNKLEKEAADISSA